MSVVCLSTRKMPSSSGINNPGVKRAPIVLAVLVAILSGWQDLHPQVE